MTLRGRPGLAAHAAMLALFALVLLSRTLVPAGYMIAPSGGWPTLTLCEGSVSAAHHQGHQPPARPKPTCAYAALAAPALPPAPPPLAAPRAPPERVLADWTARASVSPGPASLPPPSTGPPTRV